MSPGPRTRPRRGTAPKSARESALAALANQARDFPHLRPHGPETEGLEPRDAALARDIYHAAVRRWYTLSALFAPVLRHPVERLHPAAMGALLGGTAQLVFLERIPAHAAINESVEFAKRAGGTRTSGLVNAVLRKVLALVEGSHRLERWSDGPETILLSHGGSLVFNQPVLPEDQWRRLAVNTSCPVSLLDRWAEAFGPDEARDLALHTLAEPPVIVNLSSGAHEVVSEDLVPHEVEGYYVLARGGGLTRVLDSTGGWVQDPAAGAAVGLAAGLSPELIVDVCAGLGTKTRQLAAMFPRADLLATDADPARVRTLRRVFADHPRVRVVEFASLVMEWYGRADLVVLDVPCSNTGVLPRRSEARYRCDPASIERLTNGQRQILADAIPLLTPNGRILYSTCSIDSRENLEQVRWLGRWHGFAPERERLAMPRGVPGDPPTSYRDGGYACLMAPGAGSAGRVGRH